MRTFEQTWKSGESIPSRCKGPGVRTARKSVGQEVRVEGGEGREVKGRAVTQGLLARNRIFTQANGESLEDSK